MYTEVPERSLEAVAKLLRHRKPCPPLHALTLLIDDVLFLSEQMADGDYREAECHTICNKIDDILHDIDGQHAYDSKGVTSLTLKSSNCSPVYTVIRLTKIIQAAFPKLHLRGSLKISFRTDSKSMRTVML